MNYFKNLFPNSKKSNKDEVNKNEAPVLKDKIFEINHVTKIRPVLDPLGLPGLIGDISHLLSSGSEASEEFIAAHSLIRISISIPRGYITLPYGATFTEPRLNAIFVQSTGGGKGVSEKQTNAIFNLAGELNNTEQPIALHARIHSGGLSTGEGISYELRDDSTDSKGNFIQGQNDKRLIVVEAEFANLLAKCNQKTSILSGIIRKLFDGESLEPLTKTDRTSCTDPHVGILGHITATELVSRLDDTSIYNGFLNRFTICCGMPQELQPFPKIPCPDKMAELAKKLNDVLIWVNQEKRVLGMSDCYRELWEDKYAYLKQLGAKDSIEQSLLTRAPHYATMYAMLFAVLDKSNVINSSHLTSALAWIEYWHQSIIYIFDTEKDKINANEKSKIANDVLQSIENLIKQNNGQPTDRTPLQKAVGKKYNSQQVSDALQSLQEMPKPPIKITVHAHNRQVISLTKNI
ncbi:hypothetical protein L2719_15090 [Shewanella schlegeliana]|uniref:DUF3987 domain-containing protein n=1 Tax=Shewanella schlegeliana TaxID=190308 RepID=A0ABS1SZZ4_9GAMM|nr:hypothetical protein [Shewanella schlegeliana]MBL4914103.1 hypothetical protein [Shewanella schlegeliana]MCL1110860.1 hypothetical protein [Shewanella schlegeliana]GIU38628.1 hypothetical protein TUM4433_40500 [Shewanella schlegeliana]